MTWQRIDENTYIDDSLVICAEYQLFIDEMREQGKYYQPDHWTSYQFPEGKAREPVLGVRPFDAKAFCEWLSGRDDKKWQYRLPTAAEAAAHPIQLNYGHLLLSYWMVETIEKTLDTWKGGNSGFSPPEYYQIKFDIAWAVSIPSDARGISFDELQTSNLQPELLSNLELSLNLNRTHALDINFRKVVDLASLSDVHHRNLESYSNLVNATSRAINYAVSRSRILDRRTFHGNRSREITHGRDEAVDLYIDLFTLCERIAGRSPAFEGIRLVKERIR